MSKPKDAKNCVIRLQGELYLKTISVCTITTAYTPGKARKFTKAAAEKYRALVKSRYALLAFPDVQVEEVAV